MLQTCQVNDSAHGMLYVSAAADRMFVLRLQTVDNAKMTAK